jgi:hypothetical protein
MMPTPGNVSMPTFPTSIATPATTTSTIPTTSTTNKTITGDASMTELSKQTALLAQIAQNTGVPSNVNFTKTYLKDPGIVMSGIIG